MEIGKSVMLVSMLLMFILSFSLASAVSEEPTLEDNRTLVVCNIYNEDFSEGVSGVQVWFICNDNDLDVQSIYVENSSFAMTFSSDLCPLGSSIDIGAYKEGYDFYGSGSLIHPCDEGAYCLSGLDSPNGTVNIVNVAVTNINLKKSNLSGSIEALSDFHGGHGNLKKFNRTINVSVASDETPAPLIVENTPIADDSNSNEQEETTTQETSDVEPKGLSGVTGNFLASGASSWLALIVILVASLLVYFLLKKGKSSMSVPAFPKTSSSHSFY